MAYVTRREFLRLAALMGGASLFAGCSLFPENAPVPLYIKGAPGVDPLETLPGISKVYTVCGLCAGNCGICCRVAQETLVKIDGHPFHPASANPRLPFATPLEKAATEWQHLRGRRKRYSDTLRPLQNCASSEARGAQRLEQVDRTLLGSGAQRNIGRREPLRRRTGNRPPRD
jgi:hypothetical protein